jgi:hypothetical protein
LSHSHISIVDIADDYTSYPFATENPKDFYNLLSVYLDAIYFPKLDEYDFMQEGHRLELTSDPTGKPLFVCVTIQTVTNTNTKTKTKTHFLCFSLSIIY